jgi:hypothetical protein
VKIQRSNWSTMLKIFHQFTGTQIPKLPEVGQHLAQL